MHANFLGLAAVLLSLVAFKLSYDHLQKKSLRHRIVWLGIFAILSIPGVLYGVYYLHLLPEWAWFYTFRSWSGTELMVIFLGATAGAVASMLSRILLIVPLFGMLALAMLPYIKPLLAPLADSEFKDCWQSDACLQSTGATCGPASVCTILRHLGVNDTERGIARGSFSYGGGTEAWYLARYVRGKGLVPRFEFRETFTPSVGLPAMVGVRLDGGGHFIAVLKMEGDQVIYADPVWGRSQLPLAEFRRQYDSTGFHMIISHG